MIYAVGKPAEFLDLGQVPFLFAVVYAPLYGAIKITIL
jgi:hypothetical protein